MTLAIFDPEARGHHFSLHLRTIAREARRRGWEIWLVTTAEALEHPAFAMVQDEAEGAIRTVVMPSWTYKNKRHAVDLLGKHWAIRNAFAEGYRRLRKEAAPDVVYAINLDQIDLAWSLRGQPFGDTPVVGMLMGKAFHFPEMGLEAEDEGIVGRLVRPLFARLLATRNLRRVLTIDESLGQYAKDRKFPHWEKIRYVPDIAGFNATATRDEARLRLGIPEDRHVVLLFGALGERKGLVEAINAVSQDDCPKNVALLIGGRPTPFTEAQLARPEAVALREAGRLFTLTKFLDDQEEADVFAAADSVWVAYVGFPGMSGVLVQAGALGKPVLACRQGIIGWTTSRRECGLTFDPRRTDEAVAALRRLAEDPGLARRLGENGLRYAPQHTSEAFGRAICDAIGEATPGAKAPLADDGPPLGEG